MLKKRKKAKLAVAGPSSALTVDLAQAAPVASGSGSKSNITIDPTIVAQEEIEAAEGMAEAEESALQEKPVRGKGKAKSLKRVK